MRQNKNNSKKDSEDLNRLNHFLKEKIPTLTTREKIQYITIAPKVKVPERHSRHIGRLRAYSETSYSAEKTGGILSLPPPTRRKKLADDILATAFYEDDRYTCLYLEKMTVSVWE
jgi:hypothetical protein